MKIKVKINKDSLKKKLAIRDGQDADESKVVAEAVKQVIDQLPPPQEIKPVEGLEIVERINDLPTNEDKYLIDIKHIDGLLDRLEKLRQSIISIPRGGGGRSGGGMKTKDLSSQTTGSLKVFIVPKSVTAFVVGSDFPTVLMEGNGFTLNSTRTELTLTVTNAPSANSQLLYVYSSMFA